MQNIKTILSDLKWLISFIATSGIFTYAHFEFVMNYHLHIPMLVLACNICTYFIIVNRVKSVESVTTTMLKEQEKQRLKATVSTVFNEFKEIDVIDFESSAKYIYELEEMRKELGVNSFTQNKLSILLNKIDLG